MKGFWSAAFLLLWLAGCHGSPGNSTANEVEADNGSAYVPPTTAHFVNSRDNALSENLRRFYVDFAFDYPSSWAVTPPRTDGTERNFVRVAAPEMDGYEPVAFHVGMATGSGDADRDRHDIDQALPHVAERFGSGLRNYRVASVGRAHVGSYDSWNWRFAATDPGENGARPARIAGRGDILLPPGADRGVLIISIVADSTGFAPDPAQVGESGPLKTVYDSFRLGVPTGR